MNVERSWGDDTVVLDRKTEGGEKPQEPHRRRVSPPTPPIPGLRALTLAALTLVVATVLVATLARGSNSDRASIPEAANPTMPAIATPRRMPQPQSRPASTWHAHIRGTRPSGDRREPKMASAKPHDPQTPQPTPEPSAEPSPTPIPEATPARPAPTPPVVEFGM